jgi:hypothetical protein
MPDGANRVVVVTRIPLERMVLEPDAGDLHVRFDERGVETELRRGYSGTARRKGRQQTNQTYGHRATSRLYRKREFADADSGHPGAARPDTTLARLVNVSNPS